MTGRSVNLDPVHADAYVLTLATIGRLMFITQEYLSIAMKIGQRRSEQDGLAQCSS